MYQITYSDGIQRAQILLASYNPSDAIKNFHKRYSHLYEVIAVTEINTKI